MNLCLTELKRIVALFSDGIRHIKNTGFCFKRESCTNAQVKTIERISRHIIFCPSSIHESKQKRIHAYQVTVFQTAYGVNRGQDTLFIKSPQQPVTTNLK